MMLMTFVLFAQLAASGISYSEARALVGEHESHLSNEQGNRLHEIQEKALNDVMPKCMTSLSVNQPLNVSLVLSIGSDGNTVGSWIKQDNVFARCIEKALMSKTYIVPPVQPFYTLFELDLDLRRGAP